jgi:septum site-determining protein MinD
MLSTVRITVDDVMDSAGLPLMGIVLEDPNVTLAAAFGQPLLQYSRRSSAAKAFRKIANRLQGFHEPITLR